MGGAFTDLTPARENYENFFDIGKLEYFIPVENYCRKKGGKSFISHPMNIKQVHGVTEPVAKPRAETRACENERAPFSLNPRTDESGINFANVDNFLFA